MYPPTTQLEAVLRRALRAAGIVVCYRHKCRAHGCGYIEAATDAAVRRCPKDKRKMWVTSLVRPIRFHDLRHHADVVIMPIDGGVRPEVPPIRMAGSA